MVPIQSLSEYYMINYFLHFILLYKNVYLNMNNKKINIKDDTFTGRNIYIFLLYILTHPVSSVVRFEIYNIYTKNSVNDYKME